MRSNKKNKKILMRNSKNSKNMAVDGRRPRSSNQSQNITDRKSKDTRQVGDKRKKRKFEK